MGLIRSVHHVQLACKNVWKVSEKFTRGFGYHFVCSSRQGDNGLNIVLKSGHSILLLSEAGATNVAGLRNTPYAYYKHQYLSTDEKPFDIALDVANVHEVCDRIRQMNGADFILMNPVIRNDRNGEVTMAVVKSCISGLLHTVIDSTTYSGLFLPGFDVCPHIEQRLTRMQHQQSFINHLDHIALACETHTSEFILDWYRRIFDMERTSANSADDKDTGFVVKHNNTGMQLRAMKYQRELTKTASPPIQFVLVEPLEQSDPNQISRFLEANGGPGIQHIGLSVDNIFNSVSLCRKFGVSFVEPPKAYYKKSFQNLEIQEQMQSLGVLFDSEISGSVTPPSANIPILLQIFTSPLFKQDCFFVELIERRFGAAGFGAANITALWRALEQSETVHSSGTTQSEGA